MIEAGCGRVGIRFELHALPATSSFAAAAAAIGRLNDDPAVDGVLIKRPLPGALADEAILQRTRPAKDVDGYNFANVGRLVVEGPGSAPVPCTAL